MEADHAKEREEVVLMRRIIDCSKSINCLSRAPNLQLYDHRRLVPNENDSVPASHVGGAVLCF